MENTDIGRKNTGNTSEFTELRRELRITRVFTGVTSLLLICVLIGGVLVFGQVKEYAELVMPLVEQLDISLRAVDWEQLSEQIGDLDVEALNETVKNLDAKALSEALDHLNQAADTLEKAGEVLKSFLGK